MTRKLLIPAAVVALLLVGVSGWQAYRADRFRVERDTALAISAQLREADSLTALQAAADSIRADSAEAEANRRGRLADSLTALLRRPRPPVPLPDSSASDSARYWRVVAEGLQVDLLVAGEALHAREAEVADLRVALDAQRAASAKLRLAYEGEQARGDSLEVALRRAPTGCRKLLGIPFPRVGPTYGVLKGLDFAVMIPLGGC